MSTPPPADPPADARPIAAEFPLVPVGTVGFDGPRQRTLATLDAVELQDTFRGAPSTRMLRRLRRDAGASFFIALRAPQVITGPADVGRKRPQLSYLPPGAWPDHPFDTGELGQAAWGWLVEAAQAVAADAILLQASSRFRPTAANRRRLEAFFGELATDRPAPLVWDGSGLWSDEEQAALCGALGLIPCLDPLMELPPAAGRAYLRVMGQSRSEHGLSADRLDLVDEARHDLSWGAVMLNTPRPYRDALALKRLAPA